MSHPQVHIFPLLRNFPFLIVIFVTYKYLVLPVVLMSHFCVLYVHLRGLSLQVQDIRLPLSPLFINQIGLL